MQLRTIPVEPRVLRATEARLDAIYAAAKAGLSGDALAFAAGMLPQEYGTLREMDPAVSIAALKGRADSELEAAQCIEQAIRAGDARAALEKLRHRHDWVAKSVTELTVTQTISITAALEEASRRADAIEAEWRELESLPPADIAPAPSHIPDPPDSDT